MTAGRIDEGELASLQEWMAEGRKILCEIQ